MYVRALQPPADPSIACANIARAIAERYCPEAAARGSDCLWYHGIWPFYRALGLGGSAFTQLAALSPTLRELAATGRYSRVLISGAADYATLAVVLHEYRAQRMPVRCTVLDVCETPLALCRWYADSIGVEIDTVAAGILEADLGRRFDLITTHAFLGYFDQEERQRLARQWHSMLRAGGKVFLTNRLRPNVQEGVVRFTEAQSHEYLNAVEHESAKGRAGLVCDAEHVERATREYVKKLAVIPVRSLEEIKVIFEAAGFRVDRLRTVASTASAAHSGRGPTVAGTADNLELLATKRRSL